MTTTSAYALPDALSPAAREFISQSHRLLVGAERPEAADGRTFTTLDPATGLEIAEVAHAGTADVDRAEARRAGSPQRPAPRRARPRGGVPARRAERADRRWHDGRGARRASRHRQGRLHGLHGGRA